MRELVHTHGISCEKFCWPTSLDMLLTPCCRNGPCTWTWRLTRVQILNAILSVVKAFFGAKVGRKKRIETVPYGCNQGVLYLDGSQFIHCNEHFVSKMKKNGIISQNFSCDSVFKWHLGTKLLTIMNDSNYLKWFFDQKASMFISSTQFWINCVKIGKFILVCTEYIDHTSLRFFIDFYNFQKSMI